MKIDGERINIKSTDERDLVDIKNLWNNKNVMRWVGFPEGLNMTMDKIIKWYEKICTSETEKHFVVKDKNDSFCGELFYEKNIKYKSAGIDIKFLPEYQGKGLAREALTLLMEYIFENENDIDMIWTEPSEDNVNAKKLYKACGFSSRTDIYHADSEESRWEMTKNEWEEMHCGALK